MDGPKAVLHKSSKHHHGFWKAQSDISTGKEAVFPGSKLRRPLKVVQRDWCWGCFPNCPEGQRHQQQASTGETREGVPLEVHSAAVSFTPTLLSDVELSICCVFFFAPALLRAST